MRIDKIGYGSYPEQVLEHTKIEKASIIPKKSEVYLVASTTASELVLPFGE